MRGAPLAFQISEIVVECVADGIWPCPSHWILARADGVERLPEVENGDAVCRFVVVGIDRVPIGSAEIVHRVAVVADIAAHQPRAGAFLRLPIAQCHATFDWSVVWLTARPQRL